MKKLTTLSLMLFLILLVNAFPLLPSQFYGTLIVDGQYTPVGTKVSVGIDKSSICGFTITTQIGYYSVSCKGDDPSTSIIEGPTQGSLVRFYVNDTEINVTKPWKEASFARVDITYQKKDRHAIETKAPTNFTDDIILLWLFLGLMIFVIFRLRNLNEK